MIIIDRLDGEYAIAHRDENELEILITHLPKNARPGDVLIKTDDGYIIDKDTTQSRHDMLKARFDRMKRNIK